MGRYVSGLLQLPDLEVRCCSRAQLVLVMFVFEGNEEY